LDGAGAQIRFAGCDDEGWFFVNNQFVGEWHDWTSKPSFDLKNLLQVGDNVIAVGVFNGYGTGGLSSAAEVDVIGKPTPVRWSRSLFNGLAQIIVQSTRKVGEIELTASANGLTSATVTLQTK
jgi:beta-galactosidase